MEITQQAIKNKKSFPGQISFRDGTFEKYPCEPQNRNDIDRIHGYLCDDIAIRSGTERWFKRKKTWYYSVLLFRASAKSFFYTITIKSFDYLLKQSTQKRNKMVFLMQKQLAIEQNTFNENSALEYVFLLHNLIRLRLIRAPVTKTT